MASLNEAKYVFSPIMKIVSNFPQEKSITQKEIEKAPRTYRLRQYLRLLEGLDLAIETEEGYSYGNLFIELLNPSKSYGELRNAVLSYVIRERYSMLRDVFKTFQFEPYVHVNSYYYKPALEAESLLYRKPGTTIAAYGRIYRPFPTFHLTHVIRSLVEAGALHYRGRYLYGDEGLFSKMLEMRDDLPELATPSIP